FAVLKFTTNSSFVGCSTGTSAGFAPLRTLPRMTADCRHIAARLGRKRPVRQFLPCFEAEDSTEGGLLHCGISKEPLSAVGSIWSNRRARDGLVMSASVRSRPNRSGLCTRRGSSPQLPEFRNLVRLIFKSCC